MRNPSFLKKLCLALTLVVLAFGLSACGKKPKDVDPPLGANPKDYPRTYPDPATDPKP